MTLPHCMLTSAISEMWHF